VVPACGEYIVRGPLAGWSLEPTTISWLGCMLGLQSLAAPSSSSGRSSIFGWTSRSCHHLLFTCWLFLFFIVSCIFLSHLKFYMVVDDEMDYTYIFLFEFWSTCCSVYSIATTITPQFFPSVERHIAGPALDSAAHGTRMSYPVLLCFQAKTNKK
jgi:preprotein translocase subunit SecG